MGLKDGDEIYFIKKPEVKAIICGAKAVKYKGGKPMTITALAKQIFKDYNLGIAYLGGFEYFSYDSDETLYNRYNRMDVDGKLYRPQD
ncbi:MAG: hypothetical protein FWD82_00245 [Defluviitaleaceae bacterium]|nr:hypothetical protein [Defluviitaleaceae bacterium]